MNIKDEIETLSSTQAAILLLLRVENRKGEKYSPIPGRLHLVKELFAIKQTELGNKILSELKFEPDLWGPNDETIFAALEDLRNADYVETASQTNKISLSNKGKKLADELWKEVKDEIKPLFTYTKINFNHLSSERLLEKIYSGYPEMTKYSKSKIAQKYRY
jgi:hypothetical protein